MERVEEITFSHIKDAHATDPRELHQGSSGVGNTFLFGGMEWDFNQSKTEVYASPEQQQVSNKDPLVQT